MCCGPSLGISPVVIGSYICLFLSSLMVTRPSVYPIVLELRDQNTTCPFITPGTTPTPKVKHMMPMPWGPIFFIRYGITTFAMGIGDGMVNTQHISCSAVSQPKILGSLRWSKLTLTLPLNGILLASTSLTVLVLLHQALAARVVGGSEVRGIPVSG